MFDRLGLWVYDRRRRILAAWAGVFVLGVVLSGGVMERLSTDMDGPPGVESAKVAERLRQLPGSGPQVFAAVDSPRTGQQVQNAVSDIAALDGVAGVAPPVTSPDASTVLVAVGIHRGPEAAETSRAVAERLRAIEASDVKVGGSVLLDEEWQHAIEKDLHREFFALPVALVAMVVIFGGLLAASLPLAIAFSAVVGALLVLFVASLVTDLSVFTVNVVTMLGLGLGIDYGLLMVSRFREERAHGRDIGDAVRRTVATAGSTVFFSALTVAVALSGLFVFNTPVFRAFGIAGVGVILASLAAALTLLPALLGVFGHRIKPARLHRADHGYFSMVARFVQRRAVVVVVVVSVGLMLLGAPFLGAEFAMGDHRSLPRSSEVRLALELAAERFPDQGADPVIVVADVDAGTESWTRYVDRVSTYPGVAAVSVRPGTPEGMTVLEVVPEGTSQGEVAQRLVHWLRASRAPFDVAVGGEAAFLIDFKDGVASRLPVALAVIALATFVLLFLMTGSLAVPLKAIVMNLLSLGATFGALVWVFQEGHLAGWLGFDPVGSLDVFMPVLIFIFAFGLSMDYEVFLLGRIKEIYDETHDNDRAVALGLQRTGRIITSAAFLIVVVFAGFATGEVLSIKQLGFGLALAVIVDATIVRTLLVPATMRLLGDWNWWAPRPLAALHRRFGLHEGTQEAGTPDAWEPHAPVAVRNGLDRVPVMVHVGATDLRRRLPELLEQTRAGARFLVTHRGNPVAAVVPAADVELAVFTRAARRD